MTKPKEIFVNDLKEYFYYDASSPTGLRWKVDRRSGKDYNVLIYKAGDIAGKPRKNGYYLVYFNGRLVRVHRIVYSLFHNTDLAENMLIDHINGIRTDNSINNLRIVDASANQKNRHKLQKNNKSGINGVNWDEYGKRWRCEYVDYNGKTIKISFSPRTLYPEDEYSIAKQKAFEDAVRHRLSVENEENGYLTPINKILVNSHEERT